MLDRIVNKDFWMKWFLVSAVLGMAVSYQKLYLLHIVFAFIAIILVSKKLRTQSAFHFNRQPTSFHWFPLFMLLWYGMMTLFSQHMDHSLKYLFYIIHGLFIVLLMVYYSENMGFLKNVFKVLAGIFTIEIFVALVETFTPFKMPLSPFSPFISFFGRSYTPDFDIKLKEFTPTAFHWNPNDLAIAMTLIFPFFLLSKNIVVKLFGILSIFTIVIAIDSRTCILTLFFMMFLYFVMYQRKFLVKLLPLFIVLLVVSPLLYNLIKPTVFYDKVENSVLSMEVFFTQKDQGMDSIGKRQRLYTDALNSIVKSKGLGIGPGENMYIHKASIGKDYYALHNFWLELCVDVGVVFCLLFLSWHLFATYKLLRISKTSMDSTLGYYATATFLSMVGFLPAAISASSVIYFLPMWIMYGFAIAIIHNGKRLELSALTSMKK